MAIKFYNTMTRQKEVFTPITDKEVKIYTCGPTVYNYVHIGNLRAFLFEDILVRYLRYKGFKTTHVMNLTDVDDKTIRDSINEGVSLKELTNKYADAFFDDIKTLNLFPASFYPRATDYIESIVKIIKTLKDKDYAYNAKDGSVYFRIEKFKDYGKLNKIDKENLIAGKSGRVLLDEYDKDNITDFVLWKAYSEKDGDVYWETELGKGRPGWHIECSAMSMDLLGNTFDIHTGGVDNSFPHHENEIAQSEAATGEKFVNYWMHCEFLLVDGEKMSKSKGNFYTLKDLLEKGHKPEAIRYALISSHYRMQLNFTEELINQCNSSLNRVKHFVQSMSNVKFGVDENKELTEFVNKAYSNFENALDDDLNISEALASLFELIKKFNLAGEKVGSRNAYDAIDFIYKVDSVFGVFSFKEPDENIDKDIERLIEERNEARKNKDFKKSDEIRDILLEKGIILKDTKDGTVWTTA